MLTLLALLQAAAAQPDIELNIRARAKSVEIQQKGEAKLEVRAEPDAGSRVEARVEPKAEGRTKLRNVEVNIRAQASVADPGQIRVEAETETPR
jgi:SH3-like domain-containing protein